MAKKKQAKEKEAPKAKAEATLKDRHGRTLKKLKVTNEELMQIQKDGLLYGYDPKTQTATIVVK